MAKLKTGLTLMLALQLLVAGSLMAFNYQREQGSEPGLLIKGDASTVNRVEISDGEQQVVVSKQDGAWLLPDQYELPATETKISSTLDSVTDVKLVWPVSSTTSSHKRFEVADDNFQRDVKLYSGDELVAHFYLGTSPGFRKVHLRQANADEVYAVALNTFDFPVAIDEWLDKGLLNVADAQVITGPDFSIKKEGEDWSFVEAPTDAILNADKAMQLALAFSNFRVTDIVDVAPEVDPISFTVSAGGSDYGFNFYQGEEDDKFFVKRGDREQVFSLSKYDYERLAEINRKALLLEETMSNEVETNTPESETSEADTPEPAA